MSLATNSKQAAKLTKDDFASDQEPRWCPGCGDYSILTQMKKIMPELGLPKEKYVFVSGIGCSSRFPYYMDTYGFHGVHGRAPVIATGIKITNPDLKVFVITGDGDALSIGGNHFIHLCRRNVDITVLLFNNQIYGLTKGQYSPTSEKGKITKSSPFGSLESPFNPVKMALAAGATFVARTIDRDPKHLAAILTEAARHKGTSFVEIYQNCNIFNDGAFAALTDAKQKTDKVLMMDQDQPYLFGNDPEKGLIWNGNRFEVQGIQKEADRQNFLIHDARALNTATEFGLAGMSEREDMPTPMGIFRSEEKDTYEDLLARQIQMVKEEKGPADLQELLNSGNTWKVE